MKYQTLSVFLFAVIAVYVSGTAVDKACSANVGECGAAPFYCVVASTQCKCGKIYGAGTANDATCTALTCTAGGTECTDADANSECVSSKCACKAGYYVSNADDSGACTAYAIDGPCTASGDCDAFTGGAYCDTASSNQCKCGAAFSGTAGSTTCAGIACTPNTGTECSTADANSECDSATSLCKCMAGYSISGTSNKCAGGSGVTGLVSSLMTLLVCLGVAMTRM